MLVSADSTTLIVYVRVAVVVPVPLAPYVPETALSVTEVEAGSPEHVGEQEIDAEPSTKVTPIGSVPVIEALPSVELLVCTMVTMTLSPVEAVVLSSSRLSSEGFGTTTSAKGIGGTGT
jgi:hypothetical protein